MKVIINQASLHGEIASIPSKSYAHRMLISAALAEGESFIGCPSVSNDITATAGCMNGLCAEVIRKANGYSVRPAGAKKCARLDCGESGSTYRFLLPVACALGTETEFLLRGRLPERPMEALYTALESHGISIGGRGMDRITCKGQLKAGDFEIPADVSSQFISGLLFALPLLEGDSRILLKGKLASAPYVNITRSVLAEFGIMSEETDYGYFVKGGQRYGTERNMTVEGDWSNAAFWLCAGAMSEKPITVTGLRMDSLQGDSAVSDILKRFGAEVTVQGDAVTVRKGKLKGIDIDAEHIPDLVPVLAVVACGAEGETRFYNAERLRAKESDRIETTKNALTALGGKVTETPDGLIVKASRLTGGTVDACGDHRIAMMAAVAAVSAEGTVEILGAEAVEKSYPAFFEDYAQLGGEIKEL